MTCMSGQDIDYFSGPYTVTFSPGTTTATFDVIILSDDRFRGTRMFQLSIDPSSLPDNVTAGGIGQAMVIIIDDDSKSILVVSKNVLVAIHAKQW